MNSNFSALDYTIFAIYAKVGKKTAEDYFFSRKGQDNEKSIILSKELFATGRAFNISAAVISVILISLYTLFW